MQCSIDGMAMFRLLCLENLIAIVAAHSGIGENAGFARLAVPIAPVSKRSAVFGIVEPRYGSAAAAHIIRISR
jgi:hypothetical protein